MPLGQEHEKVELHIYMYWIKTAALGGVLTMLRKQKRMGVLPGYAVKRIKAE